MIQQQQEADWRVSCGDLPAPLVGVGSMPLLHFKQQTPACKAQFCLLHTICRATASKLWPETCAAKSWASWGRVARSRSSGGSSSSGGMMPVQLDESNRRRVGPLGRPPSRRLPRRTPLTTPMPPQRQQQLVLQQPLMLQHQHQRQRRQRTAMPARRLLHRLPGFLEKGRQCSCSR